MPTWPAPPTTVTSAVFALVESDGAVLVDAIFNIQSCSLMPTRNIVAKWHHPPLLAAKPG